MSSQSVAETCGAVKTPTVQPWRSMAKKRAVSPLSLWVKTMSSRLVLATMPLDSAICGSRNVRSCAGAAAAPAGGSAAIARATSTARYTGGTLRSASCAAADPLLVASRSDLADAGPNDRRTCEMTGKADFTEEEWDLLREAPPGAGLVVL